MFNHRIVRVGWETPGLHIPLVLRLLHLSSPMTFYYTKLWFRLDLISALFEVVLIIIIIIDLPLWFRIIFLRAIPFENLKNEHVLGWNMDCICQPKNLERIFVHSLQFLFVQLQLLCTLENVCRAHEIHVHNYVSCLYFTEAKLKFFQKMIRWYITSHRIHSLLNRGVAHPVWVSKLRNSNGIARCTSTEWVVVMQKLTLKINTTD